MGWGGKGKGEGGGWTPVWTPMFQKGGWDKGGWGKGWGKDGKKGMSARNFHPDKRAWIGGIPEGVTFKELHEHMKPAGAKWVEVFQGKGAGTGVACFASPEE